MKKVYKVKYDIQFGDFSKKEIEKERLGGCDQILLCSVLDYPDGSGSYMWVSKDGHTGKEMDIVKIFNAWSLLAKKISDHPDCPDHVAKMCNIVFNTVKDSKMAQRRENEKTKT